jgi:hypothetical protein
MEDMLVKNTYIMEVGSNDPTMTKQQINEHMVAMERFLNRGKRMKFEITLKEGDDHS